IITDRMLKTDDGKQSLAANPIFGGLVLSEYEKTNPGELEEFDFDAMFGADKKSAVVGEALLNIANNNSKTPQNFTGNLFQTLHKQVDPDTWNDKGPLKRGLGPRICQSLWGSGSFKELCALVEHGVDTSLAARVDGEKGVGIYSGFVQPIQHVTSGMLRDIDLLNRVNAERKPIYEKLRKAVAIRLPELEPDHEDLAGDWQNQLRAADNLAVAGDYDAALPLLQTLANALQQAGAQSDGEEKLKHAAFELALSEIPQPKLKHNLIPFTKSRVKGAKMLYEALDKKGGSVTVTSWDEIKDSEMIAAFQENPGTIWGFEYLRMPYVQAAHETDEGAQPIRMMELWDAVEKTFPPDIYEKLLAKPDQTADEILQTLTLTKTPKEFSGKKEQDFEEAFKRDAKKFLLELAKQMPKGLFTSDYKDVTGNTPTITTQTSKGPETTNARMSDVMGVDQNKYMSSFACKVGLWWAKEEKKPLYYCLDGINMDDAINYKIVKNAAIAEFVNGGGLSEDAKSFGDVVTFKEIREILKNWDDLKGTVIFTLKGKVFTPEQAEQKVTEWKQKMELANQQAGRPKAPPKATFTKALNDLDKKLLERIPNTEDGDKDARDIVKKSAYLRKVANTRPSILLKYIESKCTVLAKPEYGLLSPDLSRTAVAYSKAADNEVDAKKKLMLNAIKGCHASFRVPLRNALLNARPVPVQNQAI
ncbi:MAG: hypothetical protein SFU86_07675, partial [Pirellulaceae bacterium]|nr:hypothetical protein [Pirellulaceae bacterium]